MSDGMGMVRDIVIVLVPMIMSLSVHEFAHAWSAYKLGDDTAASMGRMTLNPLSHIDFFGTLLIPIFSVVGGGFSLIGWAKPVPVSPQRFRRNVTMRRGLIITALAGPASNLVLAILVGGIVMFFFSDAIEKIVSHNPGMQHPRCWALLTLGADGYEVIREQLGIAHLGPLLLLVSRLFVLNIGLAIFNMLPVPPLDGSRILPLHIQEKMAKYTLVVFFGFLILINTAGSVLGYPTFGIGEIILGLWSFVF